MGVKDTEEEMESKRIQTKPS